MICYKRGGDIVKSVISKIPYELHIRSLNGKQYSYCGPNKNLEMRLNPDGTPKSGFEPINKVHEACMHHDYNYQLADEGIGTRWSWQDNARWIRQIRKLKIKLEWMVC